MVSKSGNFPTIGCVVRGRPELDELIAPDAVIEVLASGFHWSEGPVWSRADECLLFSDIPQNSIFRWDDRDGLSLFMKPSGYTGVADYSIEPGSNALTFDSEGRLVACEHGDRRVSRLLSGGGKETLADRYQGKRLSSPNDLIYHSNGDLYFTDPAYGLPKCYKDVENRELDFCGVFRLSAAGELTLVDDKLTHPNGVAFTPDESSLYVSQSNPDKALWMKYPIGADGAPGAGELFKDVTDEAKTMPGLPDGMTVDAAGNLFATGPGGLLVMRPDGETLGRVSVGEAIANCAWGDDGSTLYMTAHMYLCRIRTKTKGAGW